MKTSKTLTAMPQEPFLCTCVACMPRKRLKSRARLRLSCGNTDASWNEHLGVSCAKKSMVRDPGDFVGFPIDLKRTLLGFMQP